MADKYRVCEVDACGRPVSGVGPDSAGPGAILLGPQPAWLVEQGYIAPIVDAAPQVSAAKKGDSNAVRPE